MLLVFGSINADMLFSVDTLPRPGETVLCPGYKLAAGGKGANQAAAAAKVGADVHMIGHLGKDSFGDFARDVMTEAGVNCDGLALSNQATAIAVIGVDQAAENQIIVASGANLDTHPDQVSHELFGAGATILCQNEIRPEATFELLKRAKAGGSRTILNLAPAMAIEPDDTKSIDVLIVNELEAAMALRQKTIGDDPLVFAREASQVLGATVVITLGAEGAIAASPGGCFRAASLQIDPIDTTGAGDAFVGIFAAALDNGDDLRSALQKASVGAGLACTGLGAQTSQPSLVEIETHLDKVNVQPVNR